MIRAQQLLGQWPWHSKSWKFSKSNTPAPWRSPFSVSRSRPSSNTKQLSSVETLIPKTSSICFQRHLFLPQYNAKPWCTPTLTSKLSLLPWTILTTVRARTYIDITTNKKTNTTHSSTPSLPIWSVLLVPYRTPFTDPQIQNKSFCECHENKMVNCGHHRWSQQYDVFQCTATISVSQRRHKGYNICNS